MIKSKEITTEELVNLLEKKETRVIDVRPVDAYNGWRFQNEQRGGHISGAKSLSAKWANYIDWIEIVRSKGILPEHEIVLYGYSKEEAEKVADRFAGSNYPCINIYNHFVDEWTTENKLPMDFLPRFRNLVPASWVNEIISGNTPPEIDGRKVVICHSHYRNRDAYLSGHIPGAIDMDTLALEAPETWNRRSPAELKDALEKHGITSETTVIVYGKFMFPDNADEFPGSAAGDIGAIRNAMIMIYAGVKDVRVLNGGFQSWQDAGYAISTDDVPRKAIADFGVQIPANPSIIVDISKAKEMIQAKDADIVCVRSWPEYIGEVSGYNYIEKKGRMPGAIFGNCGSDAYHMENYRNTDHTVREAQETVAIWDELGITPDKHLAFYCGTGWRGSEAWFNAWLMAWPRVSVFDGGWFEWSKDPDNQYETGIPKNINPEILR